MLLDGTAETADLILLEVLRGFEDDLQFARVRRQMLRLPRHEILNSGIALQAVSHYRTLRKRGITVRKTVDCIIATYCIEHRLSLLHNDRDFEPFEQHLGLVVIR
jgi:predicted nucleic acid-binding protein